LDDVLVELDLIIDALTLGVKDEQLLVLAALEGQLLCEQLLTVRREHHINSSPLPRHEHTRLGPDLETISFTLALRGLSDHSTDI
jgi:hypothetical protein